MSTSGKNVLDGELFHLIKGTHFYSLSLEQEVWLHANTEQANQRHFHRTR